jgi:hypothetical protein
MASQKSFPFGPIALTNTYTTNLLNPAAASGGVNAGSSGQRIVLKKLRVVNKGASAATFRLFVGATGANAAGTELAYDVNVAVGAAHEIFFPAGLVLTTADFLVGGASASTTLTISGEGEIGVA